MGRPKRRRLGQNFLRDPNTARLIVDALDAPAGARVVEIGPGTGALTEHLIDRHPGLTVLEVDERAVAVLDDVGWTLDRGWRRRGSRRRRWPAASSRAPR